MMMIDHDSRRRLLKIMKHHVVGPQIDTFSQHQQMLVKLVKN